MSPLTSAISGGASSEACAAPYKKHKCCIEMRKMPDVCISHICGFLPPEDLANTSWVSRQWRAFGGANPELWLSPTLWNNFDLKGFFHKRGHTLNIIDKKVWADWTGLDVDESSFPHVLTILLGLKQMFASLEIEGDAGITLLTLPPVTLRELFVRFPDRIKDVSASAVSTHARARLLAQHGDIVETKTRLVAITNDVLKGSRNKSAAVCEALVLGKGCEMIGVTAVVALAILTEKSSSVVPPTRLFSNDPWTYTWCAELVDGYRVVVGGFAPCGLFAGYFADDARRNFGVGCLREFD